MTIDEAIAKYKEITNADANCPAHCNISCDKCVQESKQLAEWLEELKDYRDKNKMVVRIDIENMDSVKDKIDELSKYAESQYNKAIDDFSKALTTMYENYDIDDVFESSNIYSYTSACYIFEDYIYEIAEQLKEGAEE